MEPDWIREHQEIKTGTSTGGEEMTQRNSDYWYEEAIYYKRLAEAADEYIQSIKTGINPRHYRDAYDSIKQERP